MIHSVSNVGRRLRSRIRNAWARGVDDRRRDVTETTLVGSFDAPVDGDLVTRGVCLVSGWLVDPLGSSTVVVRGGSHAVVATTGHRRPDVATAKPNLAGALTSGWQAKLPVNGAPDDQVTIEVWILRPNDRTQLLGRRTVRIGNEPAPRQAALFVSLIAATSSTVQRAPVELRGWAVDAGRPVSRVEVGIDGLPTTRARLGLASLGLRDVVDEPHGIVAGFSQLVDLGKLPGTVESATIVVRAFDLEGAEVASCRLRIQLERMPAATTETLPGADLPVHQRDEWPHHEAQRRGPARGEQVPKTLIVTHDLGYGGGQLYMLELLRRLTEMRRITATVTAPTDGPLRPKIEELGVAVRFCGHHPIDKLEAYEPWLEELAGWAGSADFDSVLVNTMRAFAGANLADRLGLPCLWAIHESFELPIYWHMTFPQFLDPRIRDRATSALRSVAAVIFEARATRDIYAGYGDPRRFVVIPYGIDLAAIDAYRAGVDRSTLRDRWHIPRSATVIACVGSVEPRKGQTVLAMAFERVAASNPDAHLVIIGDQPNVQSSALHEYVARIGLSDRIHVHGIMSDIYSWYMLSDVLVSASDVESLPRSVLEAMAFGVPVLATSVFGLPELIEDRTTGWLCVDRDLESLSRSLQQVLSLSVDERVTVGCRAERLVRAHYDSSGYATAYAHLLDALVRDSRVLPSTVLGK